MKYSEWQALKIYQFYGLFSALTKRANITGSFENKHLEDFVKNVAPGFVGDACATIFSWESIGELNDEIELSAGLRKYISKLHSPLEINRQESIELIRLLSYYIKNPARKLIFVNHNICNANIEHSKLFDILIGIINGDISYFDTLINLRHHTGSVIGLDSLDVNEAIKFKNTHDNPFDYLDKTGSLSQLIRSLSVIGDSILKIASMITETIKFNNGLI